MNILIRIITSEPVKIVARAAAITALDLALKAVKR